MEYSHEKILLSNVEMLTDTPKIKYKPHLSKPVGEFQSPLYKFVQVEHFSCTHVSHQEKKL